MKLTAMLNSRLNEIEARKKQVNAKSADNAYKKNAEYFKPTANPAMEELVDLLTGKKEKKENTDLEHFIQQVRLEQQANETDKVSMSSVQLTEAQAEPTLTPTEMMLNQDITVSLLPETTLPQPLPVQIKDARQMSKERLTEKAIATYKFHMTMAKNGFDVLQPLIYRTA